MSGLAGYPEDRFSRKEACTMMHDENKTLTVVNLEILRLHVSLDLIDPSCLRMRVRLGLKSRTYEM